MNYFRTFTKGLIKENPVLVMLLGTCPTLAVTTLAMNGLGMGGNYLCSGLFERGYFSVKEFYPQAGAAAFFYRYYCRFCYLCQLHAAE